MTHVAIRAAPSGPVRRDTRWREAGDRYGAAPSGLRARHAGILAALSSGYPHWWLIAAARCAAAVLLCMSVRIAGALMRCRTRVKSGFACLGSSANVDDRGAFKFIAQNVNHALERLVVKRANVSSMSAQRGFCSVIRAKARHSCSSWLNSRSQRFVTSSIGTMRSSPRRESACLKASVGEPIGLEWICENLTQRAAGKIRRAAGQIKHLFIFWVA